MTNALQDEGCYEYIDETFNETERSSVLANSETILSEDQTDRVHSAAMKAMGKMADDTNAIRMSCLAVSEPVFSILDHRLIDDDR